MEINLKPEDDGRKFTAKIQKQQVTGIVYYDKQFFLLHNDLNNKGDTPSPTNEKYKLLKLSYKYAWCVSLGTVQALENNKVTAFKFLDINPETYKDWEVGDKVHHISHNKIKGEIVFVADIFTVLKYKGETDLEYLITYGTKESIFKSWRLISNYKKEDEVVTTSRKLDLQI